MTAREHDVQVVSDEAHGHHYLNVSCWPCRWSVDSPPSDWPSLTAAVEAHLSRNVTAAPTG